MRFSGQNSIRATVRIFVGILLCSLCMAIVSLAQERYVMPVDEAGQDPSFLAFRNKLIAAAEKRDLGYVKSIMDRNIKLSFGGHTGVKDFDKLWADKGEFWREFLVVIKNGGHWQREAGRRQNLFTAPYSFQGFPDEFDAFDHFVIFGSNVNLRSGPSTESTVKGSLSYNIVKLDDAPINQETNSQWYKVTTLGGKSGFVHRDYVRSPIHLRAGFEKTGGRWRMIFFISGD
ncbi:MAG: SH3 domain-containing protein [Pyrinomonadaceae bacterium]